MRCARRGWLGATIAGHALLGVAGSAQAQYPAAVEAGLLLQSTITDTEFALLGLSLGPSATPLAYTGRTSATGWSGALTGTYGGRAVAVAYTGVLSGDPVGPVTWSTSGALGAEPWAGRGSAMITESPTGFRIAFQHLLTVGTLGGGGEAEWDIQVALTPTGARARADGGRFATFVGPALPPGFRLETSEIANILLSRIVGPDDVVRAVNLGEKTPPPSPPPPPPVFVTFTETVTSVPEPATLRLVIVGGIVLLARGRRGGARRRAARPRAAGPGQSAPVPSRLREARRGDSPARAPVAPAAPRGQAIAHR
jgi:hypothetical protein